MYTGILKSAKIGAKWQEKKGTHILTLSIAPRYKTIPLVLVRIPRKPLASATKPVHIDLERRQRHDHKILRHTYVVLVSVNDLLWVLK